MPEVHAGIKRWPVPEGSFDGPGGGRWGGWLMFGDTRRATAFLDLESWPPRSVVNRSEYAVSFDNLPDARVVVCSMPTNPPGNYAVRVHPADWPADRKRHIARVWFPTDGTYIPLFRAHICYRPSWSGPELYWSAATGHTHLGVRTTVPDADLLALKRVRPRGKGYQVPQG